MLVCSSSLQLRESRLPLLQPTQHSILHILGLQHAHIPNRRIVQPILNRPIARIIDNLLRPHGRHRALARNQARLLQRRLHRRLLVLIHVADQTHPQGLLGAEDARRQGHVLDPRGISNRVRQARQGADVGGDANVDFLDRELCVLGAEADVAGERHVEGEAEGDGVQDGDDGLLALFDVGDAVLEFEDVAAERGGRAGGVLGVAGELALGGGLLRMVLDSRLHAGLEGFEVP